VTRNPSLVGVSLSQKMPEGRKENDTCLLADQPLVC
jgi:hypothetical protein